MAEIRNNFFGGLNTDDSYFNLPSNSYVDALNITLDALSANADLVVSNIVGNRIISHNFPHIGPNICIGAIANTIRNTIIGFFYNAAGYSSIVEYNLTTRTAVKIFNNLDDSGGVDILEFTETEKITSINIINRDEGDLLFFLDSLGRPSFLNITLFKAGTYTPVTRQIIDVHKIPPLSPPVNCAYGNDTLTVSNFLQKKLFRFKYRWVYDDNFKSTFSPISIVPLPIGVTNPIYINTLTNNNFITLTVDTGAKNVKGIELAVSIQNNQNVFGRFQLVEYFDKSSLGISDDTTYNYDFYNDGTYPFISDEESNLEFDRVPQSAGAQEMANGNVLVYGAITEGYDRTLSPNVTATVNTYPGIVTFNSISTWPFWGQRRFGIKYFDQNGVTNGILYDSEVVFPAYSENAALEVLLPYIHIEIFHVPPIWAYSYQICFTKDNTEIKYIYTVSVNTSETEYLYFEITNLALNQTKNPTTSAVVSWNFQDGDRMRLIRRTSDNTVFGTSYDSAIEGIISDPVINGVTQTGKTFVKIRNVTPFSTVTYTSNQFVIQLYRPSLPEPNNENAVFYECGIQFDILNPGTNTRIHSGDVDQSTDYLNPAEIDIYNGDVYYRVRREYVTNSFISIFTAQDRNFVDEYISAVSDVDGRPSVIDINAKEAYYPAMVRFSQAYQPNTNINGLNRFYSGDFDEYDASYGDIQRLKVRDRFMRVFQKLKVGVVPLFNKIAKNAVGDEITVVTNELLNPIQYYSGDYGIGDNKESLASFNYADYFTSNITGGIYRVSLDGITVLSVKYKMNSWALEHITTRSGVYKIYGGFDQRFNKYIITLGENNLEDPITLSFKDDPDIETNRRFESFLSFKPIMMVSLGTNFCSFDIDGGFYTHDSDTYNNFYGVQYESYITPVFNENPMFKKQPMSLTYSASSVWDCPTITTQTKSYGSTSQQSTLISQEIQLLEGQYTASFKRDINSRKGKWNGDFLKGGWVLIKFRNSSASSLVTLDVIILKYIQSPVNVI